MDERVRGIRLGLCSLTPLARERREIHMERHQHAAGGPGRDPQEGAAGEGARGPHVFNCAAARGIAGGMRTEVPHRQRFPPMDCSTLVSVGTGFAVRSATALMICPLWQYPHCTTSCSTQASWTARPTRPCPMASIVTIGRSATSSTGTRQERVATPPRCTVHAPQAPMPQPYLVPVILSSSRRTHRSGVDGSTLTSRRSPLTLSW